MRLVDTSVLLYAISRDRDEQQKANPVQETPIVMVHAAMSTKHRLGVAHWDATIIEGARAPGCTTVLSEDLNDGRDHSGVLVQNPFKDR